MFVWMVKIAYVLERLNGICSTFVKTRGQERSTKKYEAVDYNVVCALTILIKFIICVDQSSSPISVSPESNSSSAEASAALRALTNASTYLQVESHSHRVIFFLSLLLPPS